jgi:hypothetical protein
VTMVQIHPPVPLQAPSQVRGGPREGDSDVHVKLTKSAMPERRGNHCDLERSAMA